VRKERGFQTDMGTGSRSAIISRQPGTRIGWIFLACRKRSRIESTEILRFRFIEVKGKGIQSAANGKSNLQFVHKEGEGIWIFSYMAGLPVRSGADIRHGLLKKIIPDDLEMKPEEFF